MLKNSIFLLNLGVDFFESINYNISMDSAYELLNMALNCSKR